MVLYRATGHNYGHFRSEGERYVPDVTEVSYLSLALRRLELKPIWGKPTPQPATAQPRHSSRNERAMIMIFQ